MAIGYACMALGVPDAKLQSCRLKNATPRRIETVARANLAALEAMLQYNIRRGIQLFRISSDIIPFASHPVNQLPWWDIFQPEWKHLGGLIRQGGLRVSMHPGQYTVLNAIDATVVASAAADLETHARLLDSLDLDASHKIVLHPGGVYGDPRAAMQRFIRNFSRLSPEVKTRLAVENDEKFPVDDVLEIARTLAIPAVMDVFHHSLRAPGRHRSVHQWLQDCRTTWGSQDGLQKIHYSQQDPAMRAGAHSKTVTVKEFLAFYRDLRIGPVDIMLEVKDKNLSALKCIIATRPEQPHLLKEEWGRYKYLVMGHSRDACREIEDVFNRSGNPDPAGIYSVIEAALDMPAAAHGQSDAARHIWNYFDEIASPRERKEFLQRMRRFEAGQASLRSLKNYLFGMARLHQVDDLLDSYYFIED